jgi:Ca2+-binding RTX toxin-like protein
MTRAALACLLALTFAAPAQEKPRPAKPPRGAQATSCTITGTRGNDFLFDSPRDDVVCGLGGNDTLAGGGGNDVLRGGPGDDTIQGGAGSDRLLGGPGDDSLRAFDRRRDRVDGGGGYDTAWVDRRLDGVRRVEQVV